MSFISSTTVIASTPDLVLANVPADGTVYVMAWVIINSSGIISAADASSLSTSNVLGLAESVGTIGTFNVRVLGVSKPIFSGLDTTAQYYLSDVSVGEMDTAPPTASGHVGLNLGQAYNDTQFLVLKGTRYVRS